MPHLTVIYASTSGHTEYVVDTLSTFLKKEGWKIDTKRVELAKKEDLLSGDLTIVASGTWNTGSVEGQLNPHMHVFVHKTASDAELNGKKFAVIGLGDERYRYTARAADHLENFVTSHGGQLAVPTLRIVNEPYEQNEKITDWAKGLLPVTK